MIRFLLTNWWIYIPIVAILLFLTHKNNQRIQLLRREKALKELPPEERQNARLTTLKRAPGKFDRLFAKLGLRGILDHIFPKK